MMKNFSYLTLPKPDRTIGTAIGLVCTGKLLRAMCWLIIVGALIHGDGLLVGRFVPDSWPSSPPVPKKLTKKKRAAQIAQKAA